MNRIDHLYQDPHEPERRFILRYGDMTDSSSLIRVIQQVHSVGRKREAGSAGGCCGNIPPAFGGTPAASALRGLRLLEAIRILGLEKQTRFYQASTSELYPLLTDLLVAPTCTS